VSFCTIAQKVSYTFEAAVDRFLFIKRNIIKNHNSKRNKYLAIYSCGDHWHIGHTRAHNWAVKRRK
jgi:hypothetical protein